MAPLALPPIVGKRYFMVVKSGIWSILGSLSERLLAFATYIIVSREVDPEQFGYLVFVYLMIDFFAQVAAFGVRENIVRSNEISPVYLASSFRFITYMSVVLILVMLLIASPLAYLLSGYDLFVLVLVMPLQPCLVCYSGFYEGLLQRDMRFKEIALRRTVISFLAGVVGVSLALNGVGILSLIAARYVSSIVDVFLLRYITQYKVSAKPSSEVVKAIWDFGWKISVSQAFNFLGYKANEVLIAVFFGPAALAMLDVGRKLLATFYLVAMTPLQGVSLAFVSKATDPYDAYHRFVRVLVLLIVPLVALLGAFADELILILFGDKWESSGDILMISSVGVVVQVLIWFAPNLCIKQGRTDIVLLSTVVQVTILFGSGVAAKICSFDLTQFVTALIAGLFMSTLIQITIIVRGLQIPIAGFARNFFEGALIYLSVFFAAQMFFRLFFNQQLAIDSIYLNLFQITITGFAVIMFYLPYLYFSFKRINSQ
ncbi:MAG: oligosaccharide flippase family protein [Thalassolituus sp.]